MHFFYLFAFATTVLTTELIFLIISLLNTKEKDKLMILFPINKDFDLQKTELLFDKINL